MGSKRLNVLWVARGNGSGKFKAVVGNQFESLRELENIEFFSLVLEGKGLVAYIKSFFQIRKAVKQDRIDIIHAHYSFTAFVCALAFSAPVVVSLMGSDVIASTWRRRIIVLFSNFFWKKVIVKTQQMKDLIGIDKALIVPNGVDLEFYTPMESEPKKRELGWDTSKLHILFPSDPLRREKNFALLSEAVALLNRSDIEVHTMTGLSNQVVRDYYAASDLVVMTSLREGSPNAVKEALSMNKCLISTDVGDVKELFASVSGVWLVTFNPIELANCIDSVFRLGLNESDGRISMSKRSSKAVATRLLDIYLSVNCLP